MGRTRPRSFHLDITPPVEVDVYPHTLRFVGLRFFPKHMLLEYDIAPPTEKRLGFGPEVVRIYVVDDVSSEPYPTRWEDLDWSAEIPRRMTTRLERRPREDATQITISVLPADTLLSASDTPQTVAERSLATFSVGLPLDHALDWKTKRE